MTTNPLNNVEGWGGTRAEQLPGGIKREGFGGHIGDGSAF